MGFLYGVPRRYIIPAKRQETQSFSGKEGGGGLSFDSSASFSSAPLSVPGPNSTKLFVTTPVEKQLSSSLPKKQFQKKKKRKKNLSKTTSTKVSRRSATLLQSLGYESGKVTKKRKERGVQGQKKNTSLKKV